FERVSIMVILLNCMTLGMYQPCTRNTHTHMFLEDEAFDAFIYIFFALEMVVKMVALGIFGRRCYLGDTWNRLDFFIVMAGCFVCNLERCDAHQQNQAHPQQASDWNINLTAIRTVRVLRPLKAINRVPSMRILVNLLLDTLPMLGNVLLLCFFVFFIFGIIGVQLWAGLLRNRCYPEENFTLETLSERVRESMLRKLGEGRSWDIRGSRCHTGHSNPHKEAINFDNIAYAWIVIFQVITLEGWVEIMYYVMDAHSFYNFIYFILLIIVGSFFMINLCLVVIATQFSETKQREHQCATALSLTDGVCTEKDEAEDGAVEDTDGEGAGSGSKERGKKRQAARGKHGGCCRKPCRDVWYDTRMKLWEIVESKYFNRGIMIAILINTISMGIEHHEQPEELTNILEICNIVFTSMFSLEMILKLTAFGSFNYLRNPYNVFDGVIVIISVCEIVGQSDGGLSVLRTFRLLRVLKLVRFMPALRRQLVVLMKTMDNVATFCMLLMLFIFIFSILGMHIFGCKFSIKTETGDTVPDRKNFDSLLWAIVTVFQILTQEDWNGVLYNGMAATSPLAALYFVALMTFGNYVLFNLLVAILVEGFQAEVSSLVQRRSFTADSRKSSVMSLGKSSLERRSLSLVRQQTFLGSILFTLAETRVDNYKLPLNLKEPEINKGVKEDEKADSPRESLCFRIQKMMEVYKPDWCETREDWSVYLFSPQNKFRLLCQSIIAHKLFDYVVLVFIFLNCITVALERPKILQGSVERVFLTISNYIFTTIFVAEMTVKVVSMGLYLGEKAYLRSSWNILDGFLVFVSLIDIVVSMAGGAKILGVLRVLRLLRTLRPLRVISRAPGLKLVVETLITSLKPIGNIVLICCAFFIIFGILGVQLFKGKFYYCVGFDVKNITNKSDCLAASYRWVHHKYNFDNLGQALMSLFVLASKDGWVNIMYHGLDAVAIDQQPVTNNNPWMLLYFISFLLIVSFFVLNMFVGVVVENFHKCRQHQEVEEARRREEKRQRRMEKKRRKAQKLPYYASYGPARLAIHTLCTSHYLDLVITFIICINVITMSLEHYSQPQSLETALKYCNYVFTSTFVIEASLKLVAFGFRRFFKDRTRSQLFLLLLFAFSSLPAIFPPLPKIESNASLPINPTIIRIMRVLRIARLLKMATGMRALLDTVVQALPQVGNLGLLFMLLFFIYAALGVELFGELVCNADYPCEGMSRHATFENFGMAFLTLFQVSTGDNWNGIIMLCSMNTNASKRKSSSPRMKNTSGLIISPLYFVSFVLTAQFVLINVVVAVLMKHLD
uniref:Calcium voltage-gated channel subunit alpha1 Ib n=1 Tax=Tetraodon nigroviridis TaxID=99883 RepID=H3DBT9_TETNG